MSQLTSAFDELVTSINEARGSSPTLTIGAITATDILVGSNPVDPTIFDGALADPDGPQITSKISTWGASIPARGDSAVLANTQGADGTYDVMKTPSVVDGMITIQLGKMAGL
jgi:hypothetical protein